MSQYKNFNYYGTSISYKVIGKGLPFLLLHGFGEDGSVLYEMATALENDACFIIPDLPGSGLSAGAISLHKEWTMDDFASAMLALINNENIDQFIMAGHSMGGYITLAMAEKHPERLLGFGLIHSTAYADDEERKKNRLKSVAFIEKFGSAKYIAQTTPNLFGDKFRADYPNEVANHVAKYSVFTKEALKAYCIGMMNRPDRIFILSKFKNPIFFIIGDEDKAVNLEESLKQCHLPLESHITIFEKTGHIGMLEQPTGIVDSVKEYLISLKSN